jgi:hypothetical protein
MAFSSKSKSETRYTRQNLNANTLAGTRGANFQKNIGEIRQIRRIRVKKVSAGKFTWLQLS